MKNILQEQSQISEMPDDYLAKQLELPSKESTINQFLAAIEMSKRSKMRNRASALIDVAKRDRTVVQDLANQAAPILKGQSAPPTQGYASGGLVQGTGNIPLAQRLEMERDARYRVGNPPAPVQAGPESIPFFDKLFPNNMMRQREYPEFAGTSMGDRFFPNNMSNLVDRLQAEREAKAIEAATGPVNGPEFTPMIQGPTEQGLIAALGPKMPPNGNVTVPAQPTAPTTGAAAAGAPSTGARSSGGGASKATSPSAPASPMFERIKPDTEGILARIEKMKPTITSTTDPRTERLNRAMMLGAMAKSMAENPNFVGGLAGGAAEATAIGTARRDQARQESMEQARLNAQFDLAGLSATQQDLLSSRDLNTRMNMTEAELRNRKELSQMEMDQRARLAAAEMANARSIAEQNRAFDIGTLNRTQAYDMWKTQVTLGVQERLADARLTEAEKRLEISVASAAMDMATEALGKNDQLGMTMDPKERYGLLMQFYQDAYGKLKSGRVAIPQMNTQGVLDLIQPVDE